MTGRCSSYRPALIMLSLFMGGALLSGCSGIKIDRPLNQHPGDWPMFAGSPSRTAQANLPIVPPLTQEWELDLSGGIGNGSPLMVDSFLIVGNLRGELYAANARTGERIGWTKLGEAIQGSPVVEGGIAYVALANSGESLLAFDLRSGKATWRRNYGDLEVSPLMLNSRLYFGNTKGVFFCVEPRSGELIWQYQIPDNKLHDGFRSSPAGEGKSVVVGGEDGTVYAFDAEKGTVLWSYNTGSPIMATPSIASGRVYLGDLQGKMCAFDLGSGGLLWQHASGSPIYANAAAADSLVIFGNLAGTLTALRTDNGTVSWQNHLESPINSGPAVAGDYLYIGTLKKFLFAVKVADGSIAWKEELSGRIKTSPAAVNGQLFVATDDWVVLSFRGSTR